MDMDTKSRSCLHYVSNFFLKDFARLRALTEPNMVPYGMVVDNTVLRHVFSAVVIPARAWHLIEVPIGSTLWLGQLPPQLHVILAQILCYQN